MGYLKNQSYMKRLKVILAMILISTLVVVLNIGDQTVEANSDCEEYISLEADYGYTCAFIHNSCIVINTCPQPPIL